MKLFYLLVSFILVFNSHDATAQNDSIYFWKGGVLDIKKSIKTADLDSITFKRVVPLGPTGLTGETISTTAIRLQWTDRSNNETKFKIERKLAGGTFGVIGTTAKDITTYNDTGLSPGTAYIYRVYSYNPAGNSTTYSNEILLTTTALLPTVTTTTATSITTTSASSGGSITFDGGASITAKGVCWSSTSSSPTIALSTKTSNGSGSGSFSSSITGLNAATTYYIRAYATNSAGTAYGSVVTFNTISGITLPSVTIGTQIWTSKNLDVATYSDGTVIPEETDLARWKSLTTGAWCYYNNDSGNGATYGKLYNWYAVAGIWNEASKTDASQRKKIAPAGYHVATDDEWTTLINYLGGYSLANIKLGESSSNYWAYPNPATNSTGFTALPGGHRGPYGFLYINTDAFWWTSTETGEIGAYQRNVNYDGGSAYRWGGVKVDGFSVRLLRD